MGYRGIECQNENPPFDLHDFPVPLESPIPTENNPISFACPKCLHVYIYSSRQYFASRTVDAETDSVCVRASFKCDEIECVERIVVYTTRVPSESLSAVMLRLRDSVFHLRCQKDHPIHFPRGQSRELLVKDYSPH